MCPIHHNSKNKKRTTERLRYTIFRLKSYVWIEAGSETPLLGFGFASDFSDAGVGIYVSEAVSKGTHLRVAFGSDTAEAFKGVVMWSARYTLEQHFMGHAMHSFRVGIKFIFRSEAERQRYVAFIKELNGRALELRPGMIF